MTSYNKNKSNNQQAGFASRLFAFWADTLFLTVIILSVVFLFAYDKVFLDIWEESYRAAVFAVYLTYFSTGVVYGIISDVFFNGKTFGKRIFNISTVNSNGNKLTFKESLERNTTVYSLDLVFAPFMFLAGATRSLADIQTNTHVASVPNENNIRGFIEAYAYNNKALTQENLKLFRLSDNELNLVLELLYRLKYYDNQKEAKRHAQEYFAEKFSVELYDITVETFMFLAAINMYIN